MQVSEAMTKSIVSVTSLDSIRKVAKLMKEKNIGSLPVIDKGEPVGFVTDRDIVIHCVADGYNLDGPVSHAMSENVVKVEQDQSIEEASRLMQEHKISRILVIDKENHPVGVLGLKDLANKNIGSDVLSQIKQ